MELRPDPCQQTTTKHIHLFKMKRSAGGSAGGSASKKQKTNDEDSAGDRKPTNFVKKVYDIMEKSPKHEDLIRWSSDGKTVIIGDAVRWGRGLSCGPVRFGLVLSGLIWSGLVSSSHRVPPAPAPLSLVSFS